MTSFLPWPRKAVSAARSRISNRSSSSNGNVNMGFSTCLPMYQVAVTVTG